MNLSRSGTTWPWPISTFRRASPLATRNCCCGVLLRSGCRIYALIYLASSQQMVWLCSLSLWLYMLNSRTWQGMLVLPNLSCNLEWHGAQLKPQLKKRYSGPNVACGKKQKSARILVRWPALAWPCTSCAAVQTASELRRRLRMGFILEER